MGGYKEFINIINDPNHEEYYEMLSWAEKDTGGRKFDPEYFYKVDINRKLASFHF
ncbi:IS1096 element passenger TnpR family protein [Schinkia sp. CFF1]